MGVTHEALPQRVVHQLGHRSIRTLRLSTEEPKQLTRGFTILERAVEPALVTALTAAIDRAMIEHAIPFGANEFLGFRTRRIFNLLARDEAFEQVPVHCAVLPIVEQLMDRECLLSSLTAIEMNPGETPQPLPRACRRWSATRPTAASWDTWISTARGAREVRDASAPQSASVASLFRLLAPDSGRLCKTPVLRRCARGMLRVPVGGRVPEAEQEKRDGVIFPGLSASVMLHGLLVSARLRFKDTFRSLVFPKEAQVFKKTYAHALADFEATRAASPERSEIARFLVEKSHRWLLLRADGVERPLADALWELPSAPTLETLPQRGHGRFRPSVPFDARTFTGKQIAALGELLVERGLATPPVSAALTWLSTNALDVNGALDLSGRRFALLGAAAEIAPTDLLLAAGADVLWLDVLEPPEALLRDESLSGRVLQAKGLGDVLAQPREIAAAIVEWANAAGPIDIGLFAYAPGAGREWRIAGAMNAIVDAVGPERVRSASLYVSPTHPAVLSAHELADAARRLRELPGWQRFLGFVGLLGRAGQTGPAQARVQTAVVPLQGASYQAAQYIEKLLAMERWAAYGIAGRGGEAALSANVAAITRTRSLDHPIFAAAYLGCGAFGVETFASETTRPLSALLAVHDLLNPNAPGAPTAARSANPQALFGQRVHGGLYGLSFELQPMMLAAGVLGFAKKPALLAGLLHRRGAGA